MAKEVLRTVFPRKDSPAETVRVRLRLTSVTEGETTRPRQVLLRNVALPKPGVS